MNRRVLDMVIGRHKVTRVLRDLINWGLCERNWKYEVGECSKGMRIALPYVGTPVRKVTLTEKAVVKAVCRYRAFRVQQGRAASEAYSVVFKGMLETKIDRRKAKVYVQNHYEGHSDMALARHIAIDGLSQGNYFFTVDAAAGRAHYNLSSLPSDLRRFLSVRGEALGQVDIANSQPLFFCLQFSKYQGIDKDEAARMISTLLAGTFYEDFNLQNKPREEFKKEFFRDVLYGRGNYSSATMDLFKARYPSFHLALMNSKRQGHKKLPIAMQRMEAAVIFEAVRRFDKRTHHQVPIMTIHDSLVTTIRHLELAKQVLLEVFQEMHGVQPLLRVKPFADDHKKSA